MTQWSVGQLQRQGFLGYSPTLDEYHQANIKRLKVDVMEQKLMMAKYDEPSTTGYVLQVGVHIPEVIEAPRQLFNTTIIPRDSGAVYASDVVLANTQGGATPASLFGMASSVGVLLIKWAGPKVVARIPMLIEANHPMQRLGMWIDNRLIMAIDTGVGEGRGRHINVRGADGATPGDQDDAYDEPGTAQWWNWGNWL